MSIHYLNYMLAKNIYAFCRQIFCRSNSAKYFSPREIARTMQVKMNDLTHWIYLIITLHETRTGQYFTMSENNERAKSFGILKRLKIWFWFFNQLLLMDLRLPIAYCPCASTCKDIRLAPGAPWELLFTRLGLWLLN